MPSGVVEQLTTERERLRQEHAAGASGLEVARALASSVDRAIHEIWRSNEVIDTAVVAVGGYGRGLMSPRSDVDLLFLNRKKERAAPAAKAISYALWDASLEVGGSSVRTPKEAYSHAAENIDAQTAFIDSRFLAGDETLFEEWYSHFIGQVRKEAKGFLTRLADATSERWSKAGDAGAELEPNIKEGRGGLRDLATMGWLVKAAIVGQDDYSSVSELLHRIRNELHFSTGRATDVLAMPHHVAVASALQWPSRESLSPEDSLMRDLYSAARRVAFELEEVLFPDESTPHSTLIDVLRLGRRGRRAFLRLEQSGRLLESIPVWREIWCLPQRNVYHRYSVDVHSFEVVCAAVDLAKSADDLVRRVAQESRDDLETLLYASLLHDIGKGTSDDHSERGERLARQAVADLALSSASAEDVIWLVGNHLILAKTAMRRDIGDERTIIEFAEKVGTEKRLRLLYLLTVADAVATGPAAWGQWKATLLSRLFTRVSHVLEAGELVGHAATELAQSRIEDLRRRLSTYETKFVDEHIENMPRAWLLSQPVDALVHQSEIMLEPPLGDEVVVAAQPQEQAGIWEVVVVARDRPGLFSKVAGALALHGLNVLGAQIFTREDGVALDVFRVEALGDEERRFDAVARDSQKAIKGRLSLDVRLAHKRRDYALRTPRGKQGPPEVVVDNRASDFYTVIEIHASDRVGLLYTITRALTDLELDIHLAKVATYGEDVVDAFYVRDLYGQKIEEAEHIEEIRRSVLFRLDQER